VLGALNIEKNDYDGHTLDAALEQFEALNGYKPIKAIVDLGYRGRKKVNNTIIQTPAMPPNTSPQEKARLRKAMRRRAAIEATIGHLKRDHRLNRNYYKGIAGDHYNVLLAAAAANFARWMRKAGKFYQQILACCYRLWWMIGRLKPILSAMTLNQNPIPRWSLG
jgi:IS5 family transposase